MADAHLRTGRSAVDFRARVFPLQGAARGALTARVYDSDLAVGLTVADRNVVLVLGYLGEPAIRVDQAGVAVNAASPTAAGMGLLHGPPRRANRTVWERRSSGPRVVWHDNRVRGLPSGVDRGRWRIPLIVNGRRARLAGAIQRVHTPALWQWFALGVPFICAAALPLLLGRRRQVSTAAVAFGLLASGAMLATAAGFALDTYSSEGKWVEAGNELIFVLVGVLVILRSSPNTRGIAGGALGLLGLAVGLSKIPVLLHGVVLSALPANVARALVVLTIWGGGAATAAGLGVFTNVLDSPPAAPYRPSTGRSAILRGPAEKWPSG